MDQQQEQSAGPQTSDPEKEHQGLVKHSTLFLVFWSRCRSRPAVEQVSRSDLIRTYGLWWAQALDQAELPQVFPASAPHLTSVLLTMRTGSGAWLRRQQLPPGVAPQKLLLLNHSVHQNGSTGTKINN